MATVTAVERVKGLRQEIQRNKPTIVSLGEKLIGGLEMSHNLSSAQKSVLNAVTLIQNNNSRTLHYKGRNVVVPLELSLSNVRLAKLKEVEQCVGGYLFCPIPYISLIFDGIMGYGTDYSLACNIMNEIYNLTDSKSIEFTPSILEKRGSASGIYYSKEMIELALKKLNQKRIQYEQEILKLLTYLSYTFTPSEFELVFDLGKGFEEGKTLNFKI
jgi:hypothetical protein